MKPKRLSPHIAALLALLMGVVIVPVGCNNDAERVARARRRQKEQQRNKNSTVDHLAEAMSYIGRMVELDTEAATNQISYHLNAWIASPENELAPVPAMAAQIAQSYAADIGAVRPDSPTFHPGDITHFRRSFLLSRIAEWVTESPLHDPILRDWLESSPEIDRGDQRQTLEKACRLFEWTLRNIHLEPLVRPEYAQLTQPKDLPEGMTYGGIGYRQTLLECLWRGTGDGIQRSRVFMALCAQVDVDACVIGVDVGTRKDVPWAVGVRAGDQIYLFDPVAGVHVPGPDQNGVATLSQAQSDESILRRMRVPGVFDYPVDIEGVQKVSALLDIPLESLCARMATLQNGLTGRRRMILAYQPKLQSRLLEIPSIEECKFWPIGIRAGRYKAALQRSMATDLKVLYDIKSLWGMLEPDSPLVIYTARWRHLCGQFSREDDNPGARVGYMEQRIPDTDIDNLPYDVEIQKRLLSRRLAGQSQATFNLQLKMVQAQYRRAKQAATYWLSIIQFDDSRYENAASWQRKRVLRREEETPWAPGARYNIARSLEHLDQIDEAIELYKTDGDPQEHGNRIRARLLSRRQSESSPSN